MVYSQIAIGSTSVRGVRLVDEVELVIKKFFMNCLENFCDK